jgi:hypothetical protein
MWEIIAGAFKIIDSVIRGGQWLFRHLRPDPLKTIQRRAELRAAFLKHMPAPDDYGVCGEAVIRDLRHFDSYPEQAPKKGQFPWFYVEMKGLYHRGIEVFVGTRQRINKDMYGTYKFTESTDSDTEIGYLVARICFDRIAHIDWRGDENTPIPHIFCRYNWFKQHPYESIAVFKKFGKSEVLEEVQTFRPRDLKNIF